jgi:hypothetical protein
MYWLRCACVCSTRPGVIVPPLCVEATKLARRATKPLPPRVSAFVTELNANPDAVTDEDLNRLQIRRTDIYSRIWLPERQAHSVAMPRALVTRVAHRLV